MSDQETPRFIQLTSITRFPFEAIWITQYFKKPVTITGAARKWKGKQTFNIKGSKDLVPINQLFIEASDESQVQAAGPEPPENFLPHERLVELPRHPEVEKTILGVILKTRSQELMDRVIPELDPSCFFIDANRIIFHALLNLSNRGDGINTVLLIEELRRRNKLEEVGGEAYVSGLTSGAPPSTELTGEMRLLRDAHRRRSLIDLAQRLIQSGLNPEKEGEVILRDLKTELESLSTNLRSSVEAHRISELKPQQVKWLWQGRIAIGMVTLLEGMEGIGKSTLMCAIAAAVTCGKGLPDMNLTEAANVLWLSAEDSLSYALLPRLLAAGADCTRIFAMDQIFNFNHRGIQLLKEQIAKHKPLLVIIDPIFAYLQGDGNKGQDVRGLTNRLTEIAKEFDCALLFVRHINKSKGHGDARAAGSGSIEWRAAVRSVLLAGYDPDDKKKRALTQTKNNFGPDAEPIGYLIESDKESPSGARFSWTGVSDLTAQRILSNPELDDEEKLEKKNARDQAKDFLLDILREGKVPAENIKAQADQAGISRNTLNRAKLSLNIKSTHIGSGKETVWYWELPNENGVHNGQIELDFSAVEHFSDMPNANHVGHVRNSKNPEVVNPDFSPDMPNGHVSLGDDSQVTCPVGHVSPKIVPIRHKQQQVADMPNPNHVGHVRNHVPRSKKSQINQTHCRNCGARLDPDGTCEICAQEVQKSFSGETK